MDGKSFTEILEDLHGGQLLEDADDALKRVVAAVQHAGKKGTLQVTLTLRPKQHGAVTTMAMTAKIKTTEPQPEMGDTLFYADDENKLFREDPRQTKLELKDVPAAPRPLRDINAK